ncbi:50S ribosomal protein L24e [Haloarcula salina]|uniref:Large ribosomal subunit protein eL24 n=1 Tax=Haloarcula salina TaxID=1429914 RepID=A0AA41FYG1_9EURY|nr:50S ribosomal protein L24e [Haloarcula salina]MBV0901100.1 50S ribosomal protein L24e [Haloarcula salina]
MPRTRECDYCGTDIEPGTGTMFVHKDGATTHFCSSKCENNADLGREARNLEWTASGRGTEGAVEEADAETDADAEADADADDSAAPDLEEAEDEGDADADEADETEDEEEAEEAEA